MIDRDTLFLIAIQFFEEPDFHSVWEARDSALLLQESLQSTAFDVQFDTTRKSWTVDTSLAASWIIDGAMPPIMQITNQ